MRKFISFSGGVESTTMCVLFGGDADGIFADTGFEHKLIYEQIDRVELWCKEFHRKDFKIHKIKSKYGTLPERIRNIAFYPSWNTRYCTREFKIEPIDEYLKQYKDEGVVLYIGLNVDEIEQRTRNHGNKKFIKYEYPLADNGINRNGCKIILNKAGLLPKFPAYMQRGGCIGCFYKSIKEYEAMSLLSSDEFSIVENLENELQTLTKDDRMRQKKYTIHNGISMSEIRKRASNGLFKPEEIYPEINNVTQCGVFCNR